MSLINEALKKAQRQRMEDPVVTPDTANSAPSSVPADRGAAVPRVAKRRPPMPARTQVILLAGSLALAAMGGALAFVFLGTDDAVAPAAKSPLPVQQPPAAPPVATANPPVASPATAAPDTPPPEVKVAFVPPPAPASDAKPPSPALDTPAPVTAIPSPPPAVVASPTPAGTSTAATPVQTPPTPPAPMTTSPAASTPAKPVANPKVWEFLETLRISGIRMSPTDPKVIMNDRVYRLNDLVDRTTQLRLLRVEPSLLVFIDGNGFEYLKSF